MASVYSATLVCINQFLASGLNHALRDSKGPSGKLQNCLKHWSGNNFLQSLPEANFYRTDTCHLVYRLLLTLSFSQSRLAPAQVRGKRQTLHRRALSIAPAGYRSVWRASALTIFAERQRSSCPAPLSHAHHLGIFGQQPAKTINLHVRNLTNCHRIRCSARTGYCASIFIATGCNLSA